MSKLIISFLFFISTLITQVFAAELSTYSIRDIGTLGGNYIQAAQMNNAGQVVGTSTDTSDTEYAFLYSYEDDSMINLGALDGVSSSAVSINNLGDVLVEVVDSYGNIIPALYRPDTGLRELGGTLSVLGTLEGFKLIKINDAGKILAEYTDTDSDTTHVYLRERDGTVTDLNALGINMHAVDMNGPGNVVGWINAIGMDRNGNDKAITRTTMFRDSNQQMEELLNGNTRAAAINDVDVVAGYGQHGLLFGDYLSRGFLIDNYQETEIRVWSIPRDINNLGMVVGSHWDHNGNYPRHAFVYHEDFGFQDLMNDSLYLYGTEEFKRFVDAISINDDGQIMGHGPIRNVEGYPERVFILTPIE